MTPEAIRAVVVAILRGIAPETDAARIRQDADLREELDIDSMDFLRFAVELEKRLGVVVPEVDYPRVRTIDGCVAYVAEVHAQQRAAGPARAGPTPGGIS